MKNFLESYHHLGTHPETLNPAFPATLFALIRNPDAPYALWYQLDIKSKGHFDLKIHVMVHESMASNSEAIAEIVDSTTAIHLEDIPVCEGVWKSVNGRFYKPGRFSHLEACLWQFYRYLEHQTGIET